MDLSQYGEGEPKPLSELKASYDRLFRRDWAAEDRDEDEIGCCFPGECCMPGEHFKSECHTAEMIEQWNEEGAKAEAELFSSLGREDKGPK